MRSEAYVWLARGAGFALGATIIVAILYGLTLAYQALLIIFLALLLASALEPVVDWMRARVRLSRAAALLLVYAGFFVTVIVLALLIVPGAIGQFNDLGTRLSPVLADARAWAQTVEPRGLSASLTALIDTLKQTIAPAVPDVPDPNVVIDVGMTVAEVAIAVASILALVFFWLTERARLQRFAVALLPAQRRAGARDTWNQIEVRLGSWVRGQLILMGSIGLMTTVAYLLIGLEGALLLGLIAGLAEAIPLVGPILGAIPALVVAAMTGQVETVIIVAVVYALIQTLESNVLVPIVMRNTIGVPPFIVLASVLLGAAIGGIVGALLAVPVSAAVLVVVERLQARRMKVSLDRTTVDEDALTPDPTAAEQLAAQSLAQQEQAREA